MKALIKVGYACNEHCSFCHTLDVRHVQGSTAEVDHKIRRAAELGHSMVVLSGGEPTIRPELLHWATLTASLGLDFGLVTNGQRLAYPKLVDALMEKRLRYVYLSLHGGRPKIHNLMVRSDAFDAAYKALDNLSGRGIDLSVNCVITRHNMDHLKELVDLCLPYPDLMVKFSMVEPKGGGDKLFAHLMPRVVDVAERVAEAIAYGKKHAGEDGPRFAHGAIPLCLLPGLEHLYDDLKTHRYRTMIEVGEPDYFPVDDLNKTHPSTCDGCALKGPCPGLYTGYDAEYGDVELRPVEDRPRSNSFNFAFERLAAKSTDEASCPLRDGRLGVTPWDRGRDLFVRHRGRVGLYRAESRDFSDRELIEIKHGRGQIYLDATKKDAPTDFARDLVKLRRAEVCGSCEHAPECTGLFEPVFEDVFTRDDQWVRAFVSSLQGDVLDLGCGEQPYATDLEPLGAAGSIRYVGVDPDALALADFRDRWPWADLRAATAKAALADLGDRAFDHVLILRSWNHLPAPAQVLGQVLPKLRVGGSVTIVDNVAFGLARTAAQTHQGESSKAMLEHYRNDDEGHARRALALAAQAAQVEIEIVHEAPVGPAMSNQWVVQARRV